MINNDNDFPEPDDGFCNKFKFLTRVNQIEMLML